MREQITMNLRNIGRYCLNLAKRESMNISDRLILSEKCSLVKDQSKAQYKELQTATEKIHTYSVRGIEDIFDQ